MEKSRFFELCTEAGLDDKYREATFDAYPRGCRIHSLDPEDEANAVDFIKWVCAIVSAAQAMAGDVPIDAVEFFE